MAPRPASSEGRLATDATSMILTLLERLERHGGGLRSIFDGGQLAAGRPPRWCVTAGRHDEPVQVVSSGRWARDGSLLAERSDDGVFVAESGARTIPGDDSSARERIVWVGDLALTAGAGRRSSLGEPTIEPAAVMPGLKLRWTIADGVLDADEAGAEDAEIQLSLRVTLPCRPAGEITFCNDAFDGDVWSSVSRNGRTGTRMRPYASLPEIEFIPSDGSLELEAESVQEDRWLRGAEVMHPGGEFAVEDRFSPGVFTWTVPSQVRSVGLSIRLVGANVGAGRASSRIAAVAASRAASTVKVTGRQSRSGSMGGPVQPDDLRARALALPGRLIHDQATGAAAADALRTLVAEAATFVDGDRADVALWASRAAVLVAPRPKGSLATLLLDFHRRLLERLERDDLRGGSPIAALAGLPRWNSGWFEQLQPSRSLRQRVASDLAAAEHVALAHQGLRFLEELAWRMDADLVQRTRRRARRLRRWFQDAFWLARPERLADLVGVPGASVPGASVSGVRAAGVGAAQNREPGRDAVRELSLRPSMLLAASMEGAPLSTGQRQRIVRAAEQRLVASGLGVASLDRDDLAFDGYSLFDGAGWPCLAGFFVEASLRAFGGERGRERALAEWLQSLDLDVAPMAWGHSGGAPTSAAPYAEAPFRVTRRAMPLGPLHFSLNAYEGSRARALLAGGLPASFACEAPRRLTGARP